MSNIALVTSSNRPLAPALPVVPRRCRLPAKPTRPNGQHRALAYFPYFNYIAESHGNGSIVLYAETSPDNRITKYRKTESHAAPAQERRCQNTRIPNRTRGRAVDRGLPRQPAAAPGPDNDPAGLPARTTRLRTVRPAMDPGRFRGRNTRSHSGKARHAVNSPADRPGAAGTAQTAP